MRSLRAKLIIPFILGTLTLTLALAWYTYSSARKAVEDAALNISEAKTSNAANSMSLLFKSVGTSMQNMVADPHITALFSNPADLAATKRQAEEWLTIVAQGNDYFRDLLILNVKGVCIASSNSGYLGVSFIEKPFIRQALKGIFTFGDASVGKVTGKFSMMSAGPVDSGGGIDGCLIIINDFPKIVDYDAAPLRNSQILTTAMLAPDGMFMAHSDPKVMGEESSRSLQLYQTLSNVGEQGGAVYYAFGDETYIGYARIEKNSHWVIVTSGTVSEVFAPASHVGSVVLGISGAFLFLVALVVVHFANGIIDSLLSLIHYAKRVSEGDLALQLEPSIRADELGILHNALRRLVNSLQSMILKTQEASKMKGQFLANMSHEIRTPLNAILGMTHLCARESNLPEKQRGYLDKIQLAAKSLLGIINDILDLSKVEAGMLTMESAPFNLRETVENILAIHQDNARGKSLQLRLNFEEHTPEHLVGDALRIGQVLNNLLSNAIKFTQAGNVTVRCSRTDVPSSQENRAIISISVADTGIGISEASLAKLFEPFMQADASITRKYGGTGLGLAISLRLVALMDGKISAESVEGEGTCFTFSMNLPLDMHADPNAIGGSVNEAAFDGLDLSGKRILIAEDNQINQFIIQELLAPSNAIIVMVNDGKEAVEAAIAQPFDIILMDMQMPVMDGLEATRHIRGHQPPLDVPIIAVTANAMEEDKDRGFASGMNDYLTKPIDPAQLLEILQKWLHNPAEQTR